MAYRPLYLDIHGTLLAESPFHVGTGEGWNPTTDSPVARRDASPDKECILPGSSLKGVMRAHLQRECKLLGCSPEDVLRLFGSASGSESNQGWLTVLDAVANTPTSPCELRDHVRINHAWGAADPGAKFDEEVGLPSTQFNFHCIYEGEENPACLRLLDGALHALATAQLRVGAGSSRGYGQVRLFNASCRVFRRDTAAGLKSFLSYRMNPTAVTSVDWPGDLHMEAAVPLPDVDALSTVTLTLKVECDGPVLVRSSLPPIGQANHSDAVFFQSQGKKLLPGSSLRGVCRSRAGKICASFGWPSSRVEELFGSAKDDDSGGRGLLEFSDAEAEGEELYLDHVAIDRITGFAADAKKFAAIALASPVFTATITVRYGPLHAGAVALWTLVLRDLLDGYRMWIGSGTTRGYGKVSRASIVSLKGLLASAAGRQELQRVPSTEAGVIPIVDVMAVFEGKP